MQVGGEGVARYAIGVAKESASNMTSKITDAAESLEGVTIHSQMLQQDQRLYVRSQAPRGHPLPRMCIHVESTKLRLVACLL